MRPSMFLLLSATFLCTARVSEAQVVHEASLSAGSIRAAEGVGPLGSLKISRRLFGRILVADASFGYARFRQTVDWTAGTRRTSIVTGDLQLQAQLPLRLFQPYGGLGLGQLSFLANKPAAHSSSESQTASLGVRVPTWRSTVVRAEMRARTWRDPLDIGFYRSAKEFSIGWGLRR